MTKQFWICSVVCLLTGLMAIHWEDYFVAVVALLGSGYSAGVASMVHLIDRITK